VVQLIISPSGDGVGKMLGIVYGRWSTLLADTDWRGPGMSKIVATTATGSKWRALHHIAVFPCINFNQT